MALLLKGNVFDNTQTNLYKVKSFVKKASSCFGNRKKKNEKNARKMWKIIRSVLLNKQTNEPPSEILSSDKTIEDRIIVANQTIISALLDLN